jgi:hypothetical protein
MPDVLPPLDKPAFTVLETCALFAVGRSAGYEAVKEKRWPSIGIGRTLRVPGQWVREQLGITVQPAPDDIDRRVAAFGSWCDRSAKQLLRLPPDLLGKSRRADIERHLDRHDWIDGDHVWISELLHKLADHLARL